MHRTDNTPSLIFSSSLECQKLDWVKHKANCHIHCSKIQKSSDKDDAVKLKVHKALEDRGQTIETNETMKSMDQQTQSMSKTVDLVTRLKENEELVDTHTEKQDLSCNNKVEENLHLATASHNDRSKVVVKVKYAKEKHKVEISLPCTGQQALEHFSSILHVPLERLKLIHKGKLQTDVTIMDKLKPNSVFLAFGEMAENEDGLEAEDIELIMKQLSVERNVAIKALRKTNCVVDAIFEIGNEM